jgi:cytochrome c peroxidase
MRLAFSRALHGKPEASITPASIRMAIAAYVRSLTALNSPFDRALRGDTLAMNAQQRFGFNLFMGKGRCATCHFLPFFNSTAPPLFAHSEGEIIGVPDRPVTRGARLDADSGQGRVDRLAVHLFAFKVPTLRNITLTAPYMHNGVYPTLDQVVDFYDRGGGEGIGAKVPGQTLPDSRLNLTVEEKRALVAFMGALTDTVLSPRRY